MRFALLLLFVPFVVHSSTILVARELPFVPVYAADQPDLTFEALYAEINQFQQMIGWYALVGSIESKKFERDMLKEHFEHAKELIKTGAINQDEYDKREYEYNVAEESLLEQENRAQMVRLSVETSKFNLMMLGDGKKDLRRDMAQNMKDSLGFQKQAQTHALNVAVLQEKYRKELMDAGAELVKKNIITRVEYAIRVNAFEQARNQVKTVQGQLTVVDDALFGINRSLDRLFGRNRPSSK